MPKSATSLSLVTGGKAHVPSDAEQDRIARRQGLIQDELTGLWVYPEPYKPMYVVVPNGLPGIAISCSSTRKGAAEWLLVSGLRATHHIERF